MANPIIQLMHLWQIIPIVLLMFFPPAGLNLRLGRRHSNIISVLYSLLGCVTLVMLSAGAGGDGRIIICNIWFVVLLAAYFSVWACAVRAPDSHKLLVLAVMLYCAAMLNATSVSFLSLLLDKDRLAGVHNNAGLLLLLCLLIAVWVLIWYFLQRVLQERLLYLEDRKAGRGVVYLCVLFVLFCLTAYDPFYEFQTRPPLDVISLAATGLAACLIFFHESTREKSRTEAACDSAVRQIQYRQLSRAVEEVCRLRREMRCSLNQYDAAYARLENQERSGDPLIDAIQEYFLCQAAAEEIPVKCKISIKNKSGMDEADLTALLSACLENAMATLRTLPPEEKRLSVMFIARSGILMVQTTNEWDSQNSAENFSVRNMPPLSECEGPTDVSLQQVSAIAKKYGGFVQFQRENRKFTVQTALCMCWPLDI